MSYVRVSVQATSLSKFLACFSSYLLALLHSFFFRALVYEIMPSNLYDPVIITLPESSAPASINNASQEIEEETMHTTTTANPLHAALTVQIHEASSSASSRDPPLDSAEQSSMNLSVLMTNANASAAAALSLSETEEERSGHDFGMACSNPLVPHVTARFYLTSDRSDPNTLFRFGPSELGVCLSCAHHIGLVPYLISLTHTGVHRVSIHLRCS